MSEEIRVHVVKYKNRKNLVMRYIDPATGKQVTKSAETTHQRDAERKAAKWEAELREGRYQKPTRTTWQDFRQQHEKHVLAGMKPSTAEAYDTTLNRFEALVSPRLLADVTTARVTAFATALRDGFSRPATVAHHLRHLKAVLRWAHRQGYLLKLPTIDSPKQAKGMRGRPITGEEFDRMIEAVASGLFPKPKREPTADELRKLDQRRQPIIDSWRFYLRGLWASGLRLSESLALRWDDAPGAIVVELERRRPMLRIPAEAEKGNTHRILPITPEFAALLASVPKDERRGWVFRPLTNLGAPAARTKNAIGPRVAAIGKAAKVVTDERERKGKPCREFASAHDLRRSFGFRWSRRVKSFVLRELMRHESVTTTEQYYVGLNAEATADELWESPGSTQGSSAETSQSGATENACF